LIEHFLGDTTKSSSPWEGKDHVAGPGFETNDLNSYLHFGKEIRCKMQLILIGGF